jgi:large subunit ribosomal protein L21
MFAVIKTGGLQYRVAEDQVLKIGKVKGEPGEIIQLGNVIMLGGDTPQLGNPISGASVAAEVIEQARGPKVIAFKKRRRKNSRRKRGFRASYTLIRVTEILTDGKAPSKAARPRPQPKPKAEKPEGEAGKTKAKAKTKAKTSAKKPKAAAKKPAAKAKAKS